MSKNEFAPKRFQGILKRYGMIIQFVIRLAIVHRSEAYLFCEDIWLGFDVGNIN